MIARRTNWTTREWRPGPDYRVICPCQHHARRERSTWRRALRVASRSVAVLLGVPFALAAFDIPTEAMNANLASLRPRMLLQKVPLTTRETPKEAPRPLPIFTAPVVSERFMSSDAVQQLVSLDSFKEEYFRTAVPYGSIIYREAKKNGISPELVAAMVHTESDFRVGLVSHKSAQGLMQIVPETARLLGVANVFDPEQNIAAGTRYYRYLLNRFENERIALAAYNAGEGKVERCGCIPEFAETRRYIEKVNARKDRYRQRVRNSYLAAVRMRPAAH